MRAVDTLLDKFGEKVIELLPPVTRPIDDRRDSMDGMSVAYHRVSTGGRGDAVVSNTIRLPAPTAVVAEISLCTFDTASASFGTPITAFGVFTGCTTNGTNPPLPTSETFAQGSLSGPPRPVVVRSGLTSITYEIDVSNSAADFVVNLFFWPAVVRGNL
jgi:hypothetical protein